jgi:hypothetical protein
MAGDLQSAMGGLTFGEGAFPGATQAAFGGMGGAGYGVGYGGQSQGASIMFQPAGNQAAAAAQAPAGGAMDTSGILVIGGIILAVIVVIALLGSKEHHGRGRR